MHAAVAPDTFMSPSVWSGRIYTGNWAESRGGVGEKADLELHDAQQCLHQAASLLYEVCMATGRHLVHESVAGDYVDALTAEAVVPFAAMKASGFGAVGGPADIEEFTRWQWLTRRHARAPAPGEGGR